MQIHRVAAENDVFQVLLALRDNRRKRAQRREIFVEGVAPINALLETADPTASTGSSRSRRAHAVAYEGAYASGRRLSDWALDVISRLAPRTAYELTPELMQRLSDRAESSELVVIAGRPDRSLESVALSADSAVAVVDRPSSPGNLGSLIRSADAFGIDAVVTTGHGVDLYDPRVIRASLGACFLTPVVHEPSVKRLCDWLARARALLPDIRVCGTDSAGAVSLPDAAIARPLVVVFGNEATGLSVALREVVDGLIAIPMTGRVNSLNLACAASVVFYQVQRREAPAREAPA